MIPSLHLRRGVSLSFAFCLALSAAAFADERPEKEASSGASVSGVVSTVSGDIITIMNGRIAIDATGARFDGRSGGASISDVTPGVRIVATIRNSDAAAGATLQAVHIAILDLPDGMLAGPITAINTAAGTFTVLGATVQVTTATRILKGRENAAGTIADLKVGDHVVAEVRVATGGLIAETLLVLPPVPSVSLDGTVKSIGAASWVIAPHEGADITVIVNADTKIEGSPKVGDAVRIIGNRDAAGNIVATAILPSIPRGRVTKPPTLIEGTVKAIGATSWTITTGRDGHDVVVQVNAQTKIEGTPQVGDHVLVLANADAAGALVAIAITKKPTSMPDLGLSSFEGVVKSIAHGIWTVETTRVLVTRETKISGNPVVGDRVRVSGHKAPDGSYLAVTIEKR